MNKIFNKKQILTIPNLLSLFRILLIPVIIWLYLVKKHTYAATGVILLSGATDIADGIIARKCNMVSNFGKIIDPIADKFTQGTLIICLSFKYPLMLSLVVLFVLKEIIMASLGAITIKKHDSVNSAKWHGKVNTIIIYSAIILMVFFPELPKLLVNIMITVCSLSMLTSLILYTGFYIKFWKKQKNTNCGGEINAKISCRH